jgi:hypothetical protein
VEHVVFFPSADGNPSFRRVAGLEDAVRLVEHLRNVEGVAEVSVHALAGEIPLAFRTWYRVEVPAAEVEGLAALETAAASVPPLAGPVADRPVEAPSEVAVEQPAAHELFAAPAAEPVPVFEPAPSFEPAPTFEPAPSFEPAPTFEPAPSFEPAAASEPAVVEPVDAPSVPAQAEPAPAAAADDHAALGNGHKDSVKSLGFFVT